MMRGPVRFSGPGLDRSSVLSSTSGSGRSTPTPTISSVRPFTLHHHTDHTHQYPSWGRGKPPLRMLPSTEGCHRFAPAHPFPRPCRCGRPCRTQTDSPPAPPPKNHCVHLKPPHQSSCESRRTVPARLSHCPRHGTRGTGLINILRLLHRARAMLPSGYEAHATPVASPPSYRSLRPYPAPEARTDASSRHHHARGGRPPVHARR